MNPNVDIQISNIAVQLKNLAMQLENISQTKYLVKPNLSNQFENMGIQTLNIGMQLICIGIMKRNSANENPNLGQQLKDLGNQILNFGLSLDNNNNKIPMDMQKLINQKMNFIPGPEIWTLKFSYNYNNYEVYISPTRSVQDAINLFKVQANIINNMEMKFMIGSFPLSPHLEIGKSGLVNGSIIFVSTPIILG